MESKPLVTVITPAYNCAEFIKQTMDSVLNQDYGNIQYIVIDDNSTDKTTNVIADYGLSVWKIYNAVNKGEQITTNIGLHCVDGKYFMVVNADDPLLPGAISTLVDVMEEYPGILCAYPDWRSINEDDSIRTHIKTRDYDFNYMVRHHTCLPSVGSMFRSEVIKLVGYRDIDFRWLGDFDYWLRVGLAGKMARVPIEQACWRHRDGQASSQKSDARAQEHIRLMAKFFALAPEYRHIEREARCWSYLVAAAVTDHKRSMVKYVWQAIRQHPRLLGGVDFYHALASHAYYILRR